MTAASDLALVSRFYGARGDRATIDEVMSPSLVWDITPGFPFGGLHHSLEAVLGEFLPSFGRLFSSVAAHPEQVIADGEGHVVALGHYSVAGASGRSTNVRFVHTWTISDGRIAHLHQVADSLVLEQFRQAEDASSQALDTDPGA